MSDDDDAADAAARLETALERIARLARPAPAEVSTSGESVDTAAIAARLDALISQLRGVLDG